MKTKIYADYSAFLDRTDKKENGVSTDFAKLHPDWQKENDSNESSWNCYRCYGCSRCYDCYDCYGCYDCSRCSDCSDCYDCYGCYGCSRCSDCSDCYDCYGCSDCSDCYDLNNARPVAKESDKSWFDVPKIPNIHSTVLKAVAKPGALDMRDWHTCDTTHCRAGWVVTLAGEKGKALEKSSSTLFAAMQIYKASSEIKVSPVRFFEKDAVALADMKRCADEEAKVATA